MSILRTRKVTPLDGETNLALGDSGDTITIPSGATITNSGIANGFGGGKVLQVVSDTGTSSVGASTSTSYQDIDTIGTITPASTSNKVIVMLSYYMYTYSGGNDTGTHAKIVRNNTTDVGAVQRKYIMASGANPSWQGVFTNILVDSPSSSSAVQYNLYQRADWGGTYLQSGSYPWYCILMEIEG